MSRHLITQAQAADELGVDISTIRRWISAGKLTAFRVGDRHIRIDRASLDAVLTPLGPRAR